MSWYPLVDDSCQGAWPFSKSPFLMSGGVGVGGGVGVLVGEETGVFVGDGVLVAVGVIVGEGVGVGVPPPESVTRSRAML